MNERWGVGNKKDNKAFETGKLGDGTSYELIFGEHPHSRQDSNIYARFEDGEIIGFDGHRILMQIEFETYNYLKTSYLSGNEIRKGGECKIYLNGKICYTFGFRDIFEALLMARSKLHDLTSLPVQLWQDNYDNLIGRKVYYKNKPGVITHFFGDQGAVIIQFEDGHKRPLEPYEAEDLKKGESVEPLEDDVKDDILSPHIWWHRK